MRRDFEEVRRLKMDLDKVRAEDFREAWPTGLALILTEGRRIGELALEFGSLKDQSVERQEAILLEMQHSCVTACEALQALTEVMGGEDFPALLSAFRQNLDALSGSVERLEDTVRLNNALAAKMYVRQDVGKSTHRELVEIKQLLVKTDLNQLASQEQIAELKLSIHEKASFSMWSAIRKAIWGGFW